MLLTYNLPIDFGIAKVRKGQWESPLQFKRTIALVSYFNYLLKGYKRVMASEMASEGLGKAREWGERLIR